MFQKWPDIFSMTLPNCNAL